MSTAIKARRASTGFTLLEVIVAVVMLVILAKFAMAKLVTPATLTLPAQAQSFADVIRRAQSLAVARGERMALSVTATAAGFAGSAAVSCPVTAPCFDARLEISHGATLTGVSSVLFNSLGQPVNNAGVALASDTCFSLSHQSGSIATHKVIVASLTGRVSITVGPPVCP
jgi:prepilin-type N-terminal cleavage/methylation domain-containing protein